MKEYIMRTCPGGWNSQKNAKATKLGSALLASIFIIATLLSPISLKATTTITGSMKDLSGTAVTGGAFVRFILRGCGGNIPRVNGTALIAPTQGAVWYKDFPADANGNVSGTLYSTRDVTGLLGGDITCGNSSTSVWYGLVPFVGGKGGPEIPVHALNTATLNISSVTPITTNPVVTSPTGDSTYIRKDAGNNPIPGALQFQGNNSHSGTETFKNINGVVYLDGINYTTMATCYAAIPVGGGACVVPPNYTETMNASMTMNKNDAGFMFSGPAVITMGTNQIIVTAGTQGVFFKGSPIHAGGGDVISAVRFNYTGTGDAFQIGGSSTTTRQFSWEDIAVGLSGSPTAVGIYLTNVVYFHMTRPAVIGDNVNAAKGIVFDGTGNFCGNATIQDPHLVNLGTGILGTGSSGASAMNSVSILGGERITSSISGSIAIDIELGFENTIIGPDFESTTTGLKLGADAIRNYAIFRSEATGTDVVALPGSTDNRVTVIDSPGPLTKSDSGTRNQISFISDLSANTLTATTLQPPASANMLLVDGNGAVQAAVQTTASPPGFLLNGTWYVRQAPRDASTAVQQALTLKRGSGAGNYTNATTSYTVADSTNLCFTVTIPTGWKLGVSASGALSTATAAVVAQAALTDNAACSTANAGILVETAPIQGAAIGVADAFALNWVITGDGNAHNIALQFKTSNAADTASLINSSATIVPTMKFELMPSN